MAVDRTTEALVVVRRCRNEQEAAVAAMCLRDAGIPVHVDGALTSAMRTEVAADVGVRVFESDLERALEALPPEGSPPEDSIGVTDEGYIDAPGETHGGAFDDASIAEIENQTADEAGHEEANQDTRGNWLNAVIGLILTLVVMWIVAWLFGMSRLLWSTLTESK